MKGPALRWATRAAVAAALAVLGVAILVPVALRTERGTSWVLRHAALAIDPSQRLSVRGARLQGTLLTGVEMHDVRVLEGDTALVVAVDTLRVRYHLLPLVRRRLEIGSLEVVNPRLRLRQRADLSWDLVYAPASEPSRLWIGVDRLSLRGGEVTLEPFPAAAEHLIRLVEVGAEVRGVRVGATVAARVERAGFRVDGGAPERSLTFGTRAELEGERLEITDAWLRGTQTDVTASGRVQFAAAGGALPERVRLTATARQLVPAEFAAVVPALATVAVRGALRLSLDGAADSLRARLAGRFDDGSEIHVDADVDGLGGAEPGLRLAGTGRGLTPLWLGRAAGNGTAPARADLDARAELRGADAASLRGPFRASLIGSGAWAGRAHLGGDVEAGRIRFALRADHALASLEAEGNATPFDSVPAGSVVGRVRGLRLPGGAADAVFRAEGRGADLAGASASATLAWLPARGAASALPGRGSVRVRLDAGRAHAAGTARLAGGTVRLDADALLGDEPRLPFAVLRWENLDLAGLVGDTVSSAFAGTLTLQGGGSSLQTARGEARLALATSRFGAWVIPGGAFRASLQGGALAASGGARIGDGALLLERARFAVAREAALGELAIRFRDVDPADLLPGLDRGGALSGTLRVTANGAPDRLDAELVLAPSALTPQLHGNGHVRASLRGERVAATGTLQSDAGTLDVRARADLAARRFHLDRLDFADLDAGRLGRAPGLRTRLAGTLRAEVTATDPAAPSGTLALHLAPSEINDARLDTLALELVADRGELRGTGGLATEGDGSATLDLRGSIVAGERHLAASLEAALPALHRLLGAAHPAGATLALRAEAREEPAGWTGTADVRGAGHLGDVQVDSATTRLRLTPTALSVDTLSLRSNVGRAEGAGVVGWGEGAGDTDLRLRAELEDATPLRPLLEVPDLWVAGGNLTARLAGPRDTLGFAATAEATGVRYNGTHAARLAASVEGRLNGDGTLAALDAQGLAAGVAAGGALLDDAALRATYHPDSGGTVQVHASGKALEVRASGRGAAEPGGWTAVLDSLQLRLDDRPWALQAPARLTLGEHRVELEPLELRSGDERIHLGGTLGADPSQRFLVGLDSVSLGPLLAVVGRGDLRGVVHGAASVAGGAAAPEATATFRVTLGDGARAGVQVDARVNASPTGSSLSASVTEPRGAVLRVAGRLPYRLVEGGAAPALEPVPGGTLALEAGGDPFPLASLEPLLDRRTADRLRGELHLDLRASGTPDAPRLEGRLAAERFGVRLREAGIELHDGAIQARLAGDRIDLERAELRSGHGRLAVAGHVGLESLAASAYDLVATLDGFRVIDSRTASATASGELRVRGSLQAPEITGEVRLRDTQYFLAPAAAEVEDVQLTEEDLRILAQRFGYVAAPDEALSAAPGDVSLDVRVVAERDLWVRRRSEPRVEIELATDVAVRQARGGPLLVTGRMEVLPTRSFVEQFGRRFQVTSGEVLLAGPPEDARFRVQASYTVPRVAVQGSPVRILLSLSGRADSLHFTLGSDPGMEEIDVVSYLATGRPASQGLDMGGVGVGNVAEQGTAAALARVAGTVEQLAEQRLGLDVVEIRPDGFRGATLVAGRYVTPRLFLGFAQPLHFGAEAREGRDGGAPQEFNVEFYALRWLTLNAQGQLSHLRFLLQTRYAY